MSHRAIDTNKILLNSIFSNRMIILSLLFLIFAYFLQDVVFTKSVTRMATHIADRKEISLGHIMVVLLPFVVALALFYISGTIDANIISKIELETLHQLTDDVIESAKTTKKKINANEFMGQIRKVFDAKNIYTHITYIVPAIIIMLYLIYTFLIINQPIGIFITLLIIALIFLTIKIQSSIISDVHHIEKCSGEFYDNIHEIMTNIDTVITSNTKEKELQNVNDAKNSTHHTTHICGIRAANSTSLLQLITLIVAIIINLLSYYLYKQNYIKSEVFISNMLLTLLFVGYYNNCITSIKEIMHGTGKISAMNEYFSDFNIIPENSHELVITNGDIKFDNVILEYNGSKIFDNLNISLNGNSKIGIYGPIGCGKTTLLKVLAGTLQYNGDIYIDDQNLRECSYESIAKHIAYISQHPKLFNRSIIYNIGYGTTYTDNEITDKLTSLGLLPFFESFNNKLDTIVGKEGINLSGGQRQFIALLRAIVQDKPIILLDEPTSSLDKKTRDIFMDVIRKLQNKTIIVATHDTILTPLFDRIIDFKNLRSNNDTEHEQIQIESPN